MHFYHRRAWPSAAAIEFSTGDGLSILIAIPVHNERKSIVDVLSRVRAFHNDILVVNDASDDGTGELLDDLDGQAGLRVLHHEQNLGYGRSIIDSFNYAAAGGYDWVITLDADEQHEPEMIPSFKRLIESNAWDIISGTRYPNMSNVEAAGSLVDGLPHAPAGHEPPGDRLRINRTITATINDLFGWQLTDSFCGYKAHRVSATVPLQLDEAGYAFPLQLWPRVFDAGLRLNETPVRRIYNDLSRTFGDNLDDADIRLRHYLNVLGRELKLIAHPSADEFEQPTVDAAAACCGCEEC